MDEIETVDIYENNKKCFKIQDKLLGNLNIVQNESNSMLVLWNKYQIFIFEDYNLDIPTKTLIPEFQIQSLCVANNYLVCLDRSGNVHVTTLKFKSVAQKRFKTSFQPREQGILSSVPFSAETILSIKIESDTYFLCLHQINTEFQLEKQVLLTINELENTDKKTTQENCILKCHELRKNDFQTLRDRFNVSYDIGRKYSLILLSFDKITVYGCLFSPTMPDEEINLLKLYTNVSEICDINVVETDQVNIVISLTIGTIIKLSLEDSRNPDIIHLNTALSRVITMKSNYDMIYTDGITLWKAKNTFTKKDIKFSQFFVKHAKDFIKSGDNLICTTFSNLVYKFPIEHDSVFLKPTSEEEYCPAETILDNSEHFYKIMEEVEKANEISKKLHVEGNYLTALALSKRQDIMDEVIKSKVTVYDNYQEAIKEYPELILTDNLDKYFKFNTILFLIQLNSNIIHHTCNDILSNLFCDLKVHININTDNVLMKTTSIKLNEPLKKLELLLPFFNNKNLRGSVFVVDIKIVTNIPGALDENHNIWTVLYRKKVEFTSEYFVQTGTRNKTVSYKEYGATIEEQILNVAENEHGSLFQFINVFKSTPNMLEWNFYVKLPQGFKEKLSSAVYKEYFNDNAANFFTEQFSSLDFLTSKTNLCFEIGGERVKVEIVNYFSRPLLRISSLNLKKALHMRNFLSNIIYKSHKSEHEFVNYALYTTTENLQKSLKVSISNQDKEEIFNLIEQFNRSVYGALPL